MAPAIATTTTTAFGSKDALAVLLTTESLLFAVFGVTFSFGASGRIAMADVARLMAVFAAMILPVLAAGAEVAWADLFLGDSWPDRFAGWFPALAIALGAAAQPLFAWAFAINS